MKIKENYDLNNIIIPKHFYDSHPSEKKIENKKKNILKDPKGIYITINNKKQLMDGYASYLAAGILKIDRLNIRQLNFFEEKQYVHNSKSVYVYGKHPNTTCNKEYVWKLTNNKKDKIGKIKKGDCLIVSTKYGPAPIIVTKVEIKEYSPTIKKIKTVIGRPNNTNNK